MSDIERARLLALQSLRVLDTAPEPAFDDIAALAADLFGTPMAAVSLVDDERQWFKARVGLDVCETPRDQAFCAHALALEANDVMVVEDASQDPRFATNPFVTGPAHIRFYAGALLTDPQGHNLGTLCVIDTTPRPRPAAAELARLQNLARRVVDQLERVRCERELAEQKRLLGMAEVMSGLGHWRLDLSTGRMTWSSEMYRIYGVDGVEGEAVDVDRVLGVLDDSGGAAARALFDKAIRERSGYQYERRFRRADGEERHLHSRGGCELNERGEVVALFGVVQDITERNRAFERLAKSQARYKLLADHMADVVTRLQLDGASDYISPAVGDLLGYEPREMAGRPAQAFVHPEDVPLIEDAYGRLARGESEITLQHRAQHRDGHPVWVETRFRLVRDEVDQPKEIVAVIRDISERRALEAQLAAARDAAEAANRAKSEFLANMSHELRTPLNGVIGFSRLLAESPGLAGDDRRRVLHVREAAEALNTLINDVLDFSKLEARAVQLEARPFSVGDLVSEALAMVEPQAAEKGVSLKICGDDPGVLVGDKYRLRQVLLNFLSNAVKFTTDGVVTVRLATQDGGRPEALRIRLEVVDQGVGISPEKLPALFNRFSQADGSVTRTYGGTGLGLAISRELIELMGGQVGVASEVGTGSTFWFEVELARGSAAPRRERAENGRTIYPGRRVLVVDDVALNRELFLEMLAQHGCQVDLAADGEEAVAAVRRQAYDLVLMDVHMPVMDGMAAARAIRALGFAELPILALTASGTPEQVESCLVAGMDGHLLKPLSPQDLERALARTFDRAPGVAPPPPAADPEEEEARLAFERMVGPQTALRLVRIFQGQLAERLMSNDPAAVQADAHKIAGSAAMLGFLKLGALARELETAVLDDRPTEEPLARTLAAKRHAQEVIGAWVGRLEAGPVAAN